LVYDFLKKFLIEGSRARGLLMLRTTTKWHCEFLCVFIVLFLEVVAPKGTSGE